MAEKGPIYGVELIDSLPLGTSMMRQAMPSRDDLMAVLEVSQRAVAGYEVLLDHWRAAAVAAAELLEALTELVECSPCQNGCDPGDMTCATNKARALIRKATGQSEVQ
jgi:hypothetical protein